MSFGIPFAVCFPCRVVRRVCLCLPVRQAGNGWCPPHLWREFLEYPRSILESLRQPLEDREITISRAKGKFKFPADFILIATMNPCPCGFLGDTEKQCTCSQSQILNYQKKLSGPLLDRIDLTVSVSRVPHEQLAIKNLSLKSQHTNIQFGYNPLEPEFLIP